MRVLLKKLLKVLANLSKHTDDLLRLPSEGKKVETSFETFRTEFIKVIDPESASPLALAFAQLEGDIAQVARTVGEIVSDAKGQ